MSDTAAGLHRKGSPSSCLGRLRTQSPWLALAFCLAIVFTIRCISLLQHYDMGCDVANYLDTTNTFFGQDPTGFGLDRPPLVALPLKAFTLVFGDLIGVKLLGILLSVGLGLPFYLLARRVSPGWIAVVVTLLFVLTPAYSDMLTWGYLTMFGILSVLFTIHFLLQLLDKPSRANLFLTGLCASLVVGFHQLSLAFFIPFSLIMAIALFALNRQAVLKNYKALLAAAAIALILSLPYMPVYLRMLEMQAPAASEVAISLAPSFVLWVLGCVISLPLVALALRWTWRQNRGVAVMATVLLLYSLTLTIFVFPPPFLELNRRAHYFMYPAAWLLAGVALSHLWSWEKSSALGVRRLLFRACATILMITLLSGCLVISQLKLNQGPEAFGYLDRTRWETLAWIRSDSPTDASFAVYPEPLGWWIEARSARNNACVTNRDTVPYTFLRERSLAAERVFSRNQGLENGKLRLATTYPYGGAPGQPVLGVYVSGSYHDIMMFDDRTVSMVMEGGKIATMNSASDKEISISGDGDSMSMTTRCLVNGITVIQTATLHRDSQTAVVSYSVQSEGAHVAVLHVPVFFGFQPQSLTIDADQHSIETTQLLRPKTDRVITQINIAGDGASIQKASTGDSQVDFSFSIQGAVATVAFSFDVSEPNLDGDADVVHYEVSQIVQDSGLRHLASIDYLALDLNPNPHLASAAARGTEEWLNACPYYRLVYSEGDIRIYEVLASVLP